MRSTFSGLNTMVLGIYANQVSQETVGHNISNANTDGYSRQSVNLAAVRANYQPSLYGNLLVGAGVDSMSLTRARDIFADRQFWTEQATSTYLETRQTQYQKIESIFDDTTQSNVEKALEDFYDAWETLSVDASLSSPRIAVLGKAQVLADYVHTAAQKLQEQINVNYADMSLNVTKMNTIMKQIVQLNKSITSAEATGASANDLRDQRDLLTDDLSTYANINVYENELGMYQIVSNGITLVDGINNLTLEMSDPIYNKVYGISDYVIKIKQSGVTYQPLNGAMRGLQDAIKEDKEYIDHLANISAFMLTTLNDVHKQGIGIDKEETGGLNFYGDNNTVYEWEQRNDTTEKGVWGYYIKAARYEEHWTTNAPTRSDGLATFTMSGEPKKTEYLQGINIIKELEVNSLLNEPDGEKLVAARMYDDVSESMSKYAEAITNELYADTYEVDDVGAITSKFVGNVLSSADGNFSCIVTKGTDGKYIYTCTGVGGTAGDVYTLNKEADGTYCFYDPNGNQTTYTINSMNDVYGAVSGKVTCNSSSYFECTVKKNAAGDYIYTCTGVGGKAGAVYTLQQEADGTYSFYDSDGNKTIYGVKSMDEVYGAPNGKLKCYGNGDFECTVSKDANNNLVYTCTGVGGKAGDVYTLNEEIDGTYRFYDSDGNKTVHTLQNLVDVSGKSYSVAYDLKSGSTKKTMKILDADDTIYEIDNVSGNLLNKTTGLPDYLEEFELKGTGDGSNAVRLATLFNVNNDNRPSNDPLGTLSLNSYYNKAMTKLGSDSEGTNMKIEAQEEVMLQIEEWRQSTSGVNWNEELTNMLKFQQGFSACSRCLTTMDEMLDRLINSTGMVGR